MAKAIPSSAKPRGGFTLVELLIVITIIGILMSLLVPAVQSARETGRRSVCSNNLSQMGKAVIAHIEKSGTREQFPTGGWGWYWVGDPDRGINRHQPGGWLYNILPFIEQKNVYDLPADGQRDVITDQQRQGALEMVRTPLEWANCPSRRLPILYPKPSSGTFVGQNVASNPSDSNVVARTDYAANTGSQTSVEYQGGPADPGTGSVDNAEDNHGWRDYSGANGIIFERSEVTMAQIKDGPAFTIMLGEKYLNPDHYYNGENGSDNENMYTGYNNDVYRSTHKNYVPHCDTPGLGNQTQRFGSAHPAGCHFVFCDGHVSKISYRIDPETYQYLGSRNDGIHVELEE